MNATNVSAKLASGGTVAAMALGVSLPVSTVLDNVLLGLVLLFWLISGNVAAKVRALRHPVAIGCLVYFGVVLIGMAYGSGPAKEGWFYLRKYSDLLFVPVFMSLLADTKDQSRALIAFAVTMLVVLVLSYGLALGLIPPLPVFKVDAPDPTVFKLRITHSIMMALAAFLFAQLAERAQDARTRFCWWAVCAAAAANVLFLTQSRTGYVILAFLVGLFLFHKGGRKGLLIAASLIVVASASMYELSPRIHDRIDLAIDETVAWQHGSTNQTSTGIRLNGIAISLKIVREHPLFGVGVRGFPEAYRQQVIGTGLDPTFNPHNQYLLTAAHSGLLGLGALLFLFWQIWRNAVRISDPSHALLERALVLTLGVGCLFNSLLIDHTEGLLFVWMTGLLFAQGPHTIPKPAP
ncbi:MAG TPA: O-antigen ligase family protein [Burkholderiales bacterium]|nr:O-antigen ligase family protein [Burkholderiales bacterium]